MHPLRHPRNAALVGIIFIVIGFLYWGLAVPRRVPRRLRRGDDARVLGIAMALMAYVLVAGSPND